MILIYIYIGGDIRFCVKNNSSYYNFCTVTDRAFIFQMCFLFEKTLSSVPNILTVSFDLHFEKFNLDHNFWTVTVLVTRPFNQYQTFWPCDLHIDLWPTFSKVNLYPNFWTVDIGLFIFHMSTSIPYYKIFGSVSTPFTMPPWLLPLTYIFKTLTLILILEP